MISENQKPRATLTFFTFWDTITWRGRGLSKSFISRVIIGVTPFRVLITLLITYLLSPLPLQVPTIKLKVYTFGAYELSI